MVSDEKIKELEKRQSILEIKVITLETKMEMLDPKSIIQFQVSANSALKSLKRAFEGIGKKNLKWIVIGISIASLVIGTILSLMNYFKG